MIGRQTRSDLFKTTYQTFYKICPREFVLRENLQEGVTVLLNGSVIYWLHLDSVDESTLRGLEINSYLIDQGEEIEEQVFDVLDARIGRWDGAEVPSALMERYPEWPRNKKTQSLVVPSYGMVLVNPDTQFHFVYRKFHPDSLERDPQNFFVEGEWDTSLGSTETYKKALQHDPEWVDKYVLGKWGISNAQIHRVYPDSLLDFTPELLDKVRRKGNLFRVLDHGDASPTACGWFAALDGVYINYREYYVPGKVISYHRKSITELSAGESYTCNYADPSIFHKEGSKYGDFWWVADEYLSRDIEGHPIAWLKADNNEHATRNRINELLRPSSKYNHPVTGVSPAPGIYFIKKSQEYPDGVSHAITELGSQRRKLIGYFDGKAVYSDDREESIADHAYDTIRYFTSMHGTSQSVPTKSPPRLSIKWYRQMAKLQKNKVEAMSAA